MSFNFDKLKKKHAENSGEMWASYSDLFMVLSFVFLLLYVVSSLRSGTFSIQKHLEYKKVSHEAEDLKKQIKVYETLKDDYLKKQAATEERDLYEELMDKLTLLKEETKTERDNLEKQFNENAKKEKALNQYQQLVRNIINTNLLQKSRLDRRAKVIKNKREEIAQKSKIIEEKTQTIAVNERIIEDQKEEISQKQEMITQKNQVIAEKQEIIEQKQNEISKLNDEIDQKEASIKANNRLISNINKNLEDQIQKLKRERKRSKISKAKYNMRLKSLRKKSAQKISRLKAKNKTYKSELSEVKDQLGSASSQLKMASAVINKQESEKSRLENQIQEQNQALAQKDQALADSQKRFLAQIQGLEQQHAENMAREKKAFEESLKKEKISGLEKAKRLAEFQRNAKAKEKELADQVNRLSEAKMSAEERAEELGKMREKALAEKNALGRQVASLSDDLQEARAKLNAQKKLAKKIQDNLTKAGLKAEVDGKTGDVLISFGEDYFDNGRANLKPGMEQILKKFMPLYSESLFQDKKIADKIKSVDIVGFASPTYRGRYVDPTSLDEKDRKAAQYNLDLSYKRARSIFNYIFDTDKLRYDKQKKLLPLVKVTGRSFFSDGSKESKDAQGMSQKEFCKKYDCKKSQKVIIKFNLSE